MSQTVAEVMTRDPLTIDAELPTVAAAEQMRDLNVGAVVVADGGKLRGILTDRDIVVRLVTEHRDPQTPAGDVCSPAEHTVTPDASVADAVSMMRKAAVRRLPVVEHGEPVGIVSLGDLAMERDEKSALADISAAKPNT